MEPAASFYNVEHLVTILKDEDTPQEYICPITQDFMRDPVIAEDGHTYEREAIYAWVSKHHTSPITREFISSKRMITDVNLQNMIQEFIRLQERELTQKEIEKAREKRKEKERLMSRAGDEVMEGCYSIGHINNPGAEEQRPLIQNDTMNDKLSNEADSDIQPDWAEKKKKAMRSERRAQAHSAHVKEPKTCWCVLF